MKVIITIGHIRILLPDDAGVPTLMKTLSKGMEVRRDESWHNAKPLIEISGDPVAIEIKMVTPKTRIVLKREDDDGPGEEIVEARQHGGVRPAGLLRAKPLELLP